MQSDSWAGIQLRWMRSKLDVEGAGQDRGRRILFPGAIQLNKNHPVL